MADVAKRAGVSSMTVSRALKPGASVSEKTRDRIRAAADELGYVLDSTASGLSSRKTGFVAMTIPSINNANFAATVRGASETLQRAGFQLLLGYTDYLVEEEERLIEAFLRRRPEAIILTGGAHTERCRRMLEASGVPIVETWDLPVEPIQHVVGFSNEAAGAQMADWLVREGFSRVGFVGGDHAGDTRGAARRRGFIGRLRNSGLDDHRVMECGLPPVSMQDGALAMERLLKAWPDTDAVMCVSDLAAFGAMTACQRRGLRVPEDIAIAGFGAYDLSDHAIPRITTMDVQAARIGTTAAQIIVNELASPDTGPATQTIEIARNIAPRESTRVNGRGTPEETS